MSLTRAMSFIKISQILNVSLFYKYVPFYLLYILSTYYIRGLMVNYNIGIYCFSAQHAALMSKSNYSNPRSTALEVSTLPITPQIYHTRGQHATYHNTDLPHSRLSRYLLQHRPTAHEVSTLHITTPIYRTRGQHATYYITDLSNSRLARYLLHHRSTALEVSTLPITPQIYRTRDQHAT